MFNKETEYALRGLVYIRLQNMKNRKPGVTEIAKEIDAPPFFTAKILQRMVKAGFIRSLKGKGGGFFFEENEPGLPLITLISAIEGQSSYASCGFGLKQCDDNNPCPLHEKYAPIREAIYKMISEETVSTLAEKLYSNEKIKMKKKKSSVL